jgi:TolA-binding protein
MEGDASDFEKAMLEAGISDGPTPQSAGKTAAALGIAGLTVGGTGIASGATAAGLPLALKLLGLGALVVATTVGVGVATRSWVSRSPVATHGPVASSAVAPASTVAAPPEATTSSDAPAASIESAALAPPPSLRARPAPATTPSTHTPGATLADETASLDVARAALRSDEPSQAIQALDAYSKSYPHGMLAQEALVLRIEALTRVGDASGARTMATAFLHTYPKSPYAARVRFLVPDASNP